MRVPSWTSRLAPALALVALALVAPGCAAPDPDPASSSRASAEPIRVLAAASLTEVVEALAQSYDAPVVTSFGASSALARQIRDGAPADVFVSASPRWIDFLREAQALHGEPIVIARNRLVAVSPPASGLADAGAVDPRSLLERLAPDDRVAVADEGVPAGEYARAALENLGLLDAYRSRLVGQSDVRAVLHAVEQGQLPAGFVYATDAAVARVQVLFAFDPADHPPIEYQAAALADGAEGADAGAFLDYLQSETARAWLADAGFTVP